VAVANGIPIDVRPLTYRYDPEVVFRRLVAPARAKGKDTIGLRFVLASTAEASGRIGLSLNGRPVDLDPEDEGLTVPIRLKPGTNVRSISLPIGDRGLHEFEAYFAPDSPDEDRIGQNNRAAAMTFVAGKGHILLVHARGEADEPDEAAPLAAALTRAGLAVERVEADHFPDHLTGLLDADAVVLVNVDNSRFTHRQQEMLRRYVTDMGGGLVMTGGPASFGAGGWIGSEVAKVLPVDLDPPQKKVMPKGALVLVIDRSGSMMGEKLRIAKSAAVAAARSVSSVDFVGVVAFDTTASWAVRLQQAQDKGAIARKIRGIAEGGGTDMCPAMAEASKALARKKVGVRHVILLTDGMTAGKDCRALAEKMGKARISISTVAVGPDADQRLLHEIARISRGRFYKATDPRQLPRIFVKEAQIVRRALIIEERFRPKLSAPHSQITRGLTAAPPLEGYILTGPRGGLARVLMKTAKGDPLLAAAQMGMGRSVAFTSSAGPRWGGGWVAWGGYERFWKQVVDWAAAGKAAEAGDCEVYTDVLGREVTVSVEAVDAAGEFVQLTDVAAAAVAPDMSRKELDIRQVGPGQFRGRFRADRSGNYLISIRYRRAGSEESRTIQSVATVPYAQEYEDLTDNLALLKEVAAITGGRVLDADPRQAEVFARGGLAFPKTPLPLTVPLLIAWLALFLADVAVRRIAVDFRSVARRAGALWDRLRGRRKVRDAVIDQLMARRRQVQERFAAAAGRRAATRYEARTDRDEDLPAADEAPPPSQRRPAPTAARPEPKSEAEPAEDDSSLGRLLKAKKEARDRMGK
jgi:Mg-chelatase subunit ChlD